MDWSPCLEAQDYRGEGEGHGAPLEQRSRPIRKEEMSKGAPLLHSCAVTDSSASIPTRDALFYRHPPLRSSTLYTCRAEFFSRLLSAHHITRQDTYQRPSRSASVALCDEDARTILNVCFRSTV
jgi:hypothetical protein